MYKLKIRNISVGVKFKDLLKVLVPVFCCINFTYAQQIEADTLTNPDLSISADSIISSDSTNSLFPNASNDLQSSIIYKAEDSTLMDLDTKTIELFGNAEVSYQDIKLKAAYILLNWETNEVFAHGRPDSTQRRRIAGNPVFTQGTDTYDTDTIRYNFKSKKAIIKEITTKQGEGFIQGETVKKDSADNLYLANGSYTTCNLKKPHFHISAKKIILVNKKSVVSGPFNFVLEDIPLPIGLPFGFFPVPKKKELGTSGFVMGDYGEDPQNRGFYFRDFGYYHAFNEYFGAKILAQVYSRGSWGLGLQTNYIKRYKFTGNINLQYNFNKATGEFPAEANKSNSNDFKILWSHTPQTNRPNRSFSSSINLATNTFDRNNTNLYSYNDYTRSTSNSSVRITRNFGKLFRSSAGFIVNQNFTTKEFNAGLNYNLGLNQFNPFVPERKQFGNWYDQFRIGFDVNGGYNFTNNITNKFRSFVYTSYNIYGISNKPLTAEEIKDNENGVGNSTIIQRFDSFSSLMDIVKNGSFLNSFSIPLALPNFKLANFFNFTPSVSFKGNSYTKKLNYTFLEKDTLNYIGIDTLLGTVVIDTTAGFFNSFTTSFGMGFNTRVYGTYRTNGKRRLQAVRHTFAPSFGINYTPDLTDRFFQKTQVRSDQPEGIYLPIFEGLTSVPGKNAGMSFGFTNQVEAKLRSKSDTASNLFEKIPIINNLSLSGYYNFLADSMKLSNLNWSVNSSFFRSLINFNAAGSIDPYTYIIDPLNKSNLAGIRIKEYKWKNSFKNKGSYFTSFNLSLSTKISPKTFGIPEKSAAPDPNNEAEVAVADFARANPMAYVDFNIPWTMNISYNLNYQRQGLANSLIRQVVRIDGDFSLTEKWRFTYGSGYDFQFKQVTLTNLGVVRDLHCWTMYFNWTPITGNNYRTSSYSFTIQARSSLLQDLKLMRRRQNFDLGGF